MLPRPNQFCRHVARRAPLPAIVGANAVDRIFEHGEFNVLAQSEINLRNFERLQRQRKTERQHIEQMLGEREAGELERELLMMYRRP